ncbi:MAG: hypothetical protein LQ343_002496 [Gyalolechia ehrenbergii]|nr:MAG: hypothetical protein LQ343_002496 [Gyalolechia ehrenbergii]
MRFTGILALGLVAITHPAIATEPLVNLEVRVALDSRSANIHFSQPHQSVYPFTVTYGACYSLNGRNEAYHSISEVHDRGTDRLIWVLPDDISPRGCLSAWSPNAELVGRSEPLKVNKNSKQWTKKRHLDRGTRLNKRASIPMTSGSGIDANGPWFDGVEVLKQAEINTVDAAEAKAKLHTAYLEGGPSDYQYQEMGPMRFPESIQYAGSNETIPLNDMKLVFQLADIMNQLNEGQSNYTVNFIPWIQESPNGLVYLNGFKQANGLPPTVADIDTSQNSTTQPPVDPTVGNITDAITELSCTPELMEAAGRNVFTAYKAFVDTGLGGLGGDDWSEFAYVHDYLKYSLNATDQAINAGSFGGAGGNSLWDSMFASESS